MVVDGQPFTHTPSTYRKLIWWCWNEYYDKRYNMSSYINTSLRMSHYSYKNDFILLVVIFFMQYYTSFFVAEWRSTASVGFLLLPIVVHCYYLPSFIHLSLSGTKNHVKNLSSYWNHTSYYYVFILWARSCIYFFHMCSVSRCCRRRCPSLDNLTDS